MKSFDDIFRRNVDKAFSSYNADHLVDEGWNSFMAAKKKGRRFGAGFPFWAKAASVVLFVGAGALIGYLAVNHEVTEDTLSASGAETGTEIPVIRHSEPVSRDTPVIAGRPEPLTGNVEEAETAVLKLHNASEHLADTARSFDNIILPYTDTTIMPLVADSRFLFSEDSINRAVEDALKKLQESESREIITAEEMKPSGNTSVIAGVSGLLSHVSDAASSAPGVSIGFYLEQKITSRISIRPGLALAVNSIGIDNMAEQSELEYSVPLYDGNSGTLTSFSGQLSVFAMEFPLNVVFNVFKRGRSSIYLTAGSSTMIYFSQQFNGDFVNSYTMSELDAASGSMNSVTRYSTVNVSNDYGTLTRTDFFGLANLSAGYSLPYGKTGTMLIEPFVQFPVSDLTALNLRVRYGGISVKIRFGKDNKDQSAEK